ncbi:Zinc transporter ZIP11-like [Homarus americanus]|uniref:Zinc transporter ZIP11-like n=1 Tax=Homarus americanus TaxID=6706 RepID=A0A8J5JGX0_HOMAM|nr:Zinc transporter ZIP11-like [Homarus americanus]
MIEGASPVTQALLGTLFTWGLTAAGSAVVFLLSGTQRKVLDGSLGFAAGVMTAASFWSLLAPAIELAETSGSYGENGEWAFFPVAVGFLFGALFVYAADVFMSSIGIQSPNLILAQRDTKKTDGDNGYTRHSVYYSQQSDISEVGQGSRANAFTSIDFNLVKQRRGDGGDRMSPTDEMMKRIVKKCKMNFFSGGEYCCLSLQSLCTTSLGLAVGVGFGAIGKTPLSTFNKAKYGQLSGMVEPIAGVLGALAVSLCNPVLPYALGFAAGAMIFVVVDDIIPEAQTRDNGRLASGWCIVGFIVMMVLDVALG